AKYGVGTLLLSHGLRGRTTARGIRCVQCCSGLSACRSRSSSSCGCSPATRENENPRLDFSKRGSKLWISDQALTAAAAGVPVIGRGTMGEIAEGALDGATAGCGAGRNSVVFLPGSSASGLSAWRQL